MLRVLTKKESKAKNQMIIHFDSLLYGVHNTEEVNHSSGKGWYYSKTIRQQNARCSYYWGSMFCLLSSGVILHIICCDIYLYGVIFHIICCAESDNEEWSSVISGAADVNTSEHSPLRDKKYKYLLAKKHKADVKTPEHSPDQNEMKRGGKVIF